MSSQPNQSLIDGIRCFQELTASDTALGTADIARRLKISPVRVNRLLMTLKMIGLASQNQQKKYSPGPAVHLLAAQSYHSSKILQTIVPLLEQNPYTDRTVAVGVLWRDSVSYLYHAHKQEKLQQAIGNYPLFDAMKSSIGQMLLSEYDDDYLENLFSNRAIEDIDYAFAHIQFARENGYIHLISPKDQSHNIAIKLFLDGIDVGLAFTDIQTKNIKKYLSQLQKLSQDIQNEYKTHFA